MLNKIKKKKKHVVTTYLLLFLWSLNQHKPQGLHHTVLSPIDVLVEFYSSFLSRWGQARPVHRASMYLLKLINNAFRTYKKI